MSELLDTITGRTREKVNGKKVVAAVSGGGDSTLAAYITEKAGADILAVFVDSGLLREGERARAEELYKKMFGDRFISIDAGKEFFEYLKGVVDPEEKRKRIGKKFVEIFEAAAKTMERRSSCRAQ